MSFVASFGAFVGLSTRPPRGRASSTGCTPSPSVLFMIVYPTGDDLMSPAVPDLARAIESKTGAAVVFPWSRPPPTTALTTSRSWD